MTQWSPYMKSLLKIFKNSSINEAVFMSTLCFSFSGNLRKHSTALYSLHRPSTPFITLFAFTKIFNMKSLKVHLFLVLSSHALEPSDRWKKNTSHCTASSTLSQLFQTCLSHLILNNLSSLPKTDFHFGFLFFISFAFTDAVYSFTSPFILFCHPSL